MRRGWLLLASVAVVAGACGVGAGEAATTRAAPSTTTSAPPASPTEAERAAVLARALRELVTINNTFGPEHRFTEFLVQAALDPAAGIGMATEGPGRALSNAERQAIEAALSPLAPVRFIDDPADWRTEDLRPTVEGAVILGVGEPRFDEAGALVGVSLWCGGLCGTWLTYRLASQGGEWAIVGIEGPIAVS